MRSLAFKNVFLYYGAALSGTFSLLLFCKNCYPFHILKYFGKNSLTIMASHNSLTLLYVATTFAMYANQYITRAKDYLYAFNVFAVIMIYVVIVIEIINRFFPFIIGKEYNRKNGKKKTGIFWLSKRNRNSPGHSRPYNLYKPTFTDLDLFFSYAPVFYHIWHAYTL